MFLQNCNGDIIALYMRCVRIGEENERSDGAITLYGLSLCLSHRVVASLSARTIYCNTAMALLVVSTPGIILATNHTLYLSVARPQRPTP